MKPKPKLPACCNIGSHNRNEQQQQQHEQEAHVILPPPPAPPALEPASADDSENDTTQVGHRVRHRAPVQATAGLRCVRSGIDIASPSRHRHRHGECQGIGLGIARPSGPAAALRRAVPLTVCLPTAEDEGEAQSEAAGLLHQQPWQQGAAAARGERATPPFLALSLPFDQRLMPLLTVLPTD